MSTGPCRAWEDDDVPMEEMMIADQALQVIWIIVLHPLIYTRGQVMRERIASAVALKEIENLAQLFTFKISLMDARHKFVWEPGTWITVLRK